MQSKNKILFAGGGTLGSVTPLLAVQEQLPNFEHYWIGTHDGVEKKFVENQKIDFFSITTSKFPRYFSFQIFTALPKLLKSIKEAKALLQKIRPDIVFTAGSYVGVPVCKAAYQMKIPYCILQLDLHSNLSNSVLSRNASAVFVALDEMKEMFVQKKPVVTGIPISEKFIQLAEKKYSSKRPTILFLGGGTGSLWVNSYVSEQAISLSQYANVIHVQGKNERAIKIEKKINGYTGVYESTRDEMAQFYAESDIVVSRAGMGTISEIAALEKPAILIPIPDSHQEANALFFEKKNALIVHHQKEGSSILTKRIKHLVDSPEQRTVFSENLKNIFLQNSASRVAKAIQSLSNV